MQEGTSFVWRKAGKVGEGSNPDNSQHTRLLAISCHSSHLVDSYLLFDYSGFHLSVEK